MRASALWVALVLVPSFARAQASAIFGNGQAVTYREEKLDRQFERTRLARALSSGHSNPNCVQLLGGLLTLLAEAGPRLHKRDQNFFLEPALVNALNSQLTVPAFPSSTYFGEMVRRVLIDGKMPAEWLKVAQDVNVSVRVIDLAKLQFLADGMTPIDSLYLTLPFLLERHRVEVSQATSAVASSAQRGFREDYLDHEIAWGGLTLVDITARHGKSEAVLEEPVPKPKQPTIPFLQEEPPTHRRLITVKLASHQYLPLAKLPKGARMLVRGRLYDFNASMTHLEVRDALIFEDRDFSQGALLADPNAVARCPLAKNDLTGSVNQTGGFGQH